MDKWKELCDLFNLHYNFKSNIKGEKLYQVNVQINNKIHTLTSAKCVSNRTKPSYKIKNKKDFIQQSGFHNEFTVKTLYIWNYYNLNFNNGNSIAIGSTNTYTKIDDSFIYHLIDSLKALYWNDEKKLKEIDVNLKIWKLQNDFK